MRTRHLAAPACLLLLAGVGLTAAPAQAAPARPAHAGFSSAYCQFQDGSAAEIDANWYDGGRSVLEQVYRTQNGGADLEVTYNHKGRSRGPGGLPVTWYATGDGPLAVVVTNGGGAQCYRVLY